MALPKVATPTYELKIPSTGQKVKYRPFLVKEEKALLIALENGGEKEMSQAMQDIIVSCTEGEVNTKDLAPFDIEYFFLNLRGRSVGEELEINIPRPEGFKCCKGATPEDVVELKINIDDIKLDTSGMKSNEIDITDEIGLKLKFPNLETVQKYAADGENIKSENIFKLIGECIDYIWDGDDIFKGKDSSKKELDDFIESLSSGQFQKIREFFESMPKISHEIEWACPVCKKATPLVLSGIDSFFG
tara:strand:- start:374 stop:1111 length:738 start_codon:yes stop_codon:yes gene_type:complete